MIKSICFREDKKFWEGYHKVSSVLGCYIAAFLSFFFPAGFESGLDKQGRF